MNRKFSRYLPLLVCLFSVGFLGSPSSQGDSPPAEGVNGLLVLRNGNVIEGSITRLADNFRVSVEHGQLLVRVDQVEMFCKTLDEAYERRREMRVGSTADSHLGLAKWCLRHELLEYASRELLEARAVDPHQRNLLQIERQLNQALQRKMNSHKLPTVKTVEHMETEIDLSAVKQTPQRSRVLFVRRIQPILAKSCATNCHQADSKRQWQFNRLAVAGAGHPEITKHNLVATLGQIDFQNAGESALLRFADATHGAGASKPLSPHQLQMLQAWVEHLVAARATVKPAASFQQTGTTRSEQSSVARLAEKIRGSDDRPKLHGKAQQASDPFDPKVFNRRYSSRYLRTD